MGTYSLATSDSFRNALVYQHFSSGKAKLTSVVICNGLSKDLVNIRKKVSNLNDNEFYLKQHMLKHSFITTQ
jgi:CRISPR/Cas system CMR-associated protein Cmr5 small subunit